MAKITVKVLSNNYVNANIYIDGEWVKLKKSKDRHDRYGTMVGEIEVAKPVVPMQISNWFELDRRGWWLYAFFFWLIGVFGLLAPKYEKKCYQLSYNTTLSLIPSKDDSLIEIKFLSPLKKGYAMELSSNFTTMLNNDTNVYSRNQIAEKRRKVVATLSILSTFATIAIGIYLLIHVGL